MLKLSCINDTWTHFNAAMKKKGALLNFREIYNKIGRILSRNKPNEFNNLFANVGPNLAANRPIPAVNNAASD